MAPISRLTSTVVKTRRLYYLYEMANFLAQHGTSNYLLLQNYMLNFANEHHYAFEEYKDSSGEITTKPAFGKYLNLSIAYTISKNYET